MLGDLFERFREECQCAPVKISKRVSTNFFVVVTFLLRCAAREDNLNRSAIGGASDTVTLFLSQIWIKQFVTVF